jgi:hypothetical protein
MVFVCAKAPDAEVVKPTVQFESVIGDAGAGEKVTPVGVVGLMTTPERGLEAASGVVATLKVLGPYVPAPGLVIPAMVTVAGVLAARAHPAGRVIVTT